MRLALGVLCLTMTGSFTCGGPHTSEPQTARLQQPNASHHQPGPVQTPTSDERLPRPAIAPKANRSLASANNRDRSTRNMNAHQPVTGKSRSAVSTGRFASKSAATTRSPRQPSMVHRASVPAVNNLRHHGANPATVGGPVRSRSENGGSLGGNSLNRRR